MTGCTIRLENEKLVFYNQLSRFIIFIFFVFFCYLLVFSETKYIKIKSTGVIILLLIFVALQYYFRNTKYRFGNRPFFYIIIFGWITIENYWLAAIALLFDTFSVITTRHLDVFFSKQSIRYPSVPPKQIKWKDLNQVTLKDGLLTIDFKSNKLIQQLVDENKTTVDEKDFNDFCKKQLDY